MEVVGYLSSCQDARGLKRSILTKETETAVKKLLVEKLTILKDVSPAVQALSKEIHNLDAGKAVTKNASADLASMSEKLASMSLTTTNLDNEMTRRKDNMGILIKSLNEVEAKVKDLTNLHDSASRASIASRTSLQNLSAGFVETIESFKRQIEELKLDLDNIHVTVESTQADATGAINELSGLNAELEIMRPLIPQFFDAAANEKFEKERTSPAFPLPSRFKSSETVRRIGIMPHPSETSQPIPETEGAPSPLETRQPGPGTGIGQSVLGAERAPVPSQTVVQSDPPTSEALPQILSPGSKRRHPSSQKGQHKRPASVGGGISRPSSSSSEEQQVGQTAAAGAGGVAQPQPQPQPQPLQQQFMTAPRSGLEHIWSKLAFVPAFWTEPETIQLYNYLVKFDDEATDPYKPLAQLPRCAAREAKGESVC